MTIANAHPLFNGLRNDPSFLANLNIDPFVRTSLLAARKEIRQTLREAFRTVAATDEYWDEAYARRVNSRNRAQIEVKFMTQGSFAYKTVNAPAQAAVQEIDLDDGVYVPVEYLDNDRPALTARGMFEFIESALDSLRRERRWIIDTTKNCCVRVKLWPGAHIDLPVYSIPRDRFEAVNENLVKADVQVAAMSRGMVMDEAYKLPTDKIMLAHRDGTWIHSDPQKLHDWVTTCENRNGPIYTRLCRFFKGWRDFTWAKSTLSSVCLMRAIDLALRQLPALPVQNRDDAMILEVAKQLPDILRGKVGNPVVKDACLNQWSDSDGRMIIAGAESLKGSMLQALEKTGSPVEVVRQMQQMFGGRVPFRPDVVQISGNAISAIKAAAPATVAAPRVIPSTSG